jgi:hypothetical protein
VETNEAREIPVVEAPAGPHVTNIVAWDIPSAIVAGEKFRMKVGIKCANGCDLTNREFAVFDHEGTQIAKGTLPADRWPGTSGLHVTEVELEAPAAEGLYTWSVRSPSTLLGISPSTMLGTGPATLLGAEQESDAAISHAEGSAIFGVRVVCHPECLVTVEAVDQVSQTPLSGARVVMHPYKAVADERGIAQVRVAKGAYKLFVSQPRYVTLGLPIDVDADMTARAELNVEPVLERN